jgi:transcriptional regulator with XRE-family HTH domain
MGEIRDRIIENIRTHIKASGIEQKEIAKSLGISPSAVTSWMSGRNTPDIEIVVKLCRLLGVSLEQMIGEQKEKPVALSDGQLDDQLTDILKHSDRATKNRLVAVAKALLSEDIPRKE